MLCIINKRYCNNTVHCSPLLLTNTVYHCSKFCWGDNLRVIQPSDLGDNLGVIQLSPILWQAHPHALAVSVSFFIIFNEGYEATPLQVARVPLCMGWGILHQGGRHMLILPPDIELTYP